MRKRMITTFLGLSLVFLAACGGNGEIAESVTKETALSARQVRVSPVTKTDFALEVRSTGTLEPKNKARIKALAAGPVEEVLVDIGDRVRKNQPLLKIRQVDTRLALESAEAGLESAQAALDKLMAWQREEEVAISEANVSRTEAEFKRLDKDRERAETVFSKGAISESQLQAARTAATSAEAAYKSALESLAISRKGPTPEEIKLAESQVEQARAIASSARQALADTVTCAPFSGVVTDRHLKAGDYAGRGDPVIDIVDDSFLEAETLIPERYLSVITEGLAVTVKASSLDLERDGKVTAVSPAVDPATRTFKVKVGVENNDSYLNSGVFCTCVFRLDTIKNALGIPPEALQHSEGRTYVWIDNNGRAAKAFVQPGEGRDGFVHIKEGLTGDEKVIVEGAGALLEGAPLEVVS